MNAHHHPTDDLLFAYAGGGLDEAKSLVVATHLALCPDCRKLVADAEILGGTLIEAISGEALGANALADTLKRATGLGAAPGQPAVERGPTRATDLVFPQPLRHYAGADLPDIAWRSLGPGIQHRELIRSPSGATARLLRIQPGLSVFEHGHRGQELTLVLQGSYRSGDRQFERGDLEVADDSVEHAPVAGDGAVCICLAVTEAPLRFKNLIGRLMQPFIGI
jgi:putative transcriptional regulator